MLNLTFGRQLKAAASILTSMGLMSMVPAALADEPCQSPYMAKIKGEEQFVYVWTLGIEGVGDGSDKLVTVDVRKDSPTFGKRVFLIDEKARIRNIYSPDFLDPRLMLNDLLTLEASDS
jgi:selenium-binding protein 1